MDNRRIISADSHVFEPPDLWTTRMDAKFRDRAPSVVREADGDWWYCEGRKGMSFHGAGAQVGLRFEEPERLAVTDLVENQRPGGYIPEEHVKDMEMDGVEVSVVYPTVGIRLYSTEDSELLTAILKTYNDWLAEFCSPFPTRIKGLGMINLDDIQEGIAELERCANMGLIGALIPVYPPRDRTYDSHEYDPFWAAAQDLEMPLGLHVGTVRPSSPAELATIDSFRPSFYVNLDRWVRESLADMILSGVFERYPRLQVGAVEHELSWVPHFLDRLDYTYTQRPHRAGWHKYGEDMLPTDYFHRNVFVGFQQDDLGIRLRDIIGVDNLAWGSDYPHPESTFPRTRQILEKILADCTEEEKAKIVCENVTRIFRLN